MQTFHVEAETVSSKSLPRIKVAANALAPTSAAAGNATLR